MHSSLTRIPIYLLFILLSIQQSCLQSEATNERASLSVSAEKESTKAIKQQVQVSPPRRESLSASRYKNWVRQNLFVQKKIQELEYEVLFQPQEFIFLQQFRGNPRQDTLSQELAMEDDFQHFLLTITHTTGEDLLKEGTSDQSAYQDRLRYYSFDMQQDIKLLDGSDTLSCKMYHFERTYGLAPYGKFVLAFEKGKQQNADKTFILHDQLNGNGIIKLRFRNELLSQIPTLAL